MGWPGSAAVLRWSLCRRHARPQWTEARTLCDHDKRYDGSCLGGGRDGLRPDKDCREGTIAARQDPARRYAGGKDLLRRRDQAAIGFGTSLSSMAFDQPHPTGETEERQACGEWHERSAEEGNGIRLHRRGNLGHHHPDGNDGAGTDSLDGQRYAAGCAQ